MSDAKLWKIFSIYIRMRDADESGICVCITCGYRSHWKNMDCGHGIPRQHKATKFNELNNAAQCKRCNAFEGGRREVYKEEMDKRYGAGTWDKMQIASRQTVKWGKVEIEVMTEYYKKEVEKLKKQKHI